MGSQWSGMARALLRLPTFAASIARSAAALRPLGVDLQHVITEAPEAAFDDIVNSFVSIAAVQVALVDVLREFNVQPEGFIGHSAGEIGCAYADGTLTAEQTVLCAYWRGRCTLEARPAPGAMAAVGLSWEEAARRCPKDVELACHNSFDSVTISGPSKSISKFVEKLSKDGVFAKMVKTGGVAFHSKYVAGVASLLLARLKQVIPEPKPRSARWLSSSVPQDQWSSNLAKLSDAEYLVNNMVSPVLFADLLARVPARALLVEVAPHALLQAVLKRALPDIEHVPLVRRKAPDALIYLLAAVGKMYIHGTQPQVSRLYPAVQWPVSRGTPALASHVIWDHSTEWSVANYKTAGANGGRHNTIEFDLGHPDDAFIAGHNIEGRVLFPAAGYITLVWRTVAKMNELDIEQAAVVLENVHFRRTTVVTRDAQLRFLVTMFSGSGEFEICEGGEVVVTGTARLTSDATAERLPTATLNIAEKHQEDDLQSLDAEDIYKEFRLRGYYYEGVFRGIKSSNAHGTHGLLRWDGNWISFMDTMLQLSLIATNARSMYLPTCFQHVVIDPAAQRQAVAAAAVTDGAVLVKRYHNIDVLMSGGVEFRGLSVSQVPRRINAQAPPKLEKYLFLPNENHDFGSYKNKCPIKDALTAALQLVIENCDTHQLKLAELALHRPVEALLLPLIMEVLETEPVVHAAATLIGVDAPQYVEAMDPLQIKVSNKDVSSGGLEADCHMVLAADILARQDDVLDALAAACGTSFVLLEESTRAIEELAARVVAKTGLTVIYRACVGAREYLLLRRLVTLPSARVVVEARDDYGWVEQLKDAMKRAESDNMRVYVWSRAPCSGVQGLATCLRREPGGNRLRLYYLPSVKEAFDPDAPAFRDQVLRDLTFNVLREGVWGTFRHLLLDITGNAMVEHAYVNSLTRGDLSSLRWIESDLRHMTASTLPEHTTLCRVSYSAINFRDIMLATGKLRPDSLPAALANKDCILGFEFSGHSSTGKRVMGIAAAKGLATSVLTDESFIWEVPEQWSLQDAATVPVAYSTAYYALCVRGRMRRGESVLVHAGAGGVGQAAINVALHAGCTVFTTVGTPDKRAFLRAQYPQLPDANIGNSRDCSFEQLVLRRTRGRGVDLVVNSLAGDKLQASLRCLATGGRFLEIGKFDLSANTALGMKALLKNIIITSVLLDVLLGESHDNPEKEELIRCVNEGIATGAVRPLPTTVFNKNELEQAFRYMATGKHIGKVLICVREEEPGTALASKRMIPAIPRTYMYPNKSYVLIGGLGGFGLELGEWLVSRGARTLILNSRRGVRTGYQAWCIRRWRMAEVLVMVSATDAATSEGARALLQEAAAAAPVGGIFNLAAVVHDTLLENQTPDYFKAVAKPKINVTRALDLASRELAAELDHFVVFSSMVCGRGNAGQSNYGLANSSMERLCEQRQADGLPALAVQWGYVGEVGLAATMFCRDTEMGGMMPQRIASCLQALDTLLTQPHAVVTSMVIADKAHVQDKSGQNLVHAVANILGFRDPNKVPETATLTELGMDSLMSAEAKQTLEHGFNLQLSVQEIRMLTFGQLRVMDGSTTTQPTSKPTDLENNDVEVFVPFNELMPKKVLVKLTSKPPAYLDDSPVFMVHPIEGVIDMLRDIAALVRGAVYGLQCVRAAPLDDIAALARFYVTRVRAAQPRPPYTLLGYSFGAAIAFEMALQLEQDGCAVQIVLVDGSPAYIAGNAARFKLRVARTLKYNEAELLASLGKIFYNLDTIKVASELLSLPDWDARVTHMTELMVATGACVERDDVRDAAEGIYRRLLLGDDYKPSAQLRAPVMLFTAIREFTGLDEVYGLKAICVGEVRTRQLDATHRTILVGEAARIIADHVSDLLAQKH